MDKELSDRLIIWLYDRLQGLYPSSHRERFSAEQRGVFLQAIAAEPDRSGRLMLRELAQLPGALARAHQAALRAGGWKTLLQGIAVVLLFLVPAVNLLTRLGVPPFDLLGYAIVAGFFTALLIGLWQGFPRWTLPFAGVLVGIISIYPALRFGGSIARHLPVVDASLLRLPVRIAYSSIWVVAEAVITMMVIVFLVTILRLIPIDISRRIPSRWRRLRRWSDISFLFYGVALLQVFLAFDEWDGSDFFTLAAVLVLLAASWRFSRENDQKRAAAWLIGGVVVSFAIVATGKWWLLPQQPWIGWRPANLLTSDRIFMAVLSLVTMAWLCIGIMLPALLRPFIERQEPTSGEFLAVE